MTAGALVLSGGGSVGIAWELGFLRGLELGAPEVVRRLRHPETTFIGTSAGSIVASQVASGRDLEELLQPELDAPPSGGSRGTLLSLVTIAASMMRARIGAGSPEEVRRRIGAYAMNARTMPESDWLESIGRRLPRDDWPERRLLITAVDAETGELRVFGRDDGVDLARAVAASCAVPGVWPPVTIDGHRYMDGGMRSIANADLAAGCDPVLILAPIRDGSPGMGNVRRSELQVLAGARTRIVHADRDAARAFGRNPLNPSTRAASAAAGRRQGRQDAAELAVLWE